MKIPERYEVEATTESLAAILNNEKGSTDFFKKMRDADARPVCARCGYIDCVCTPHEAPELSQENINKGRDYV